MRLLLFAIALVGIASTCKAASTKYPVVCAAFDRSGDAVLVTISDETLRLEIESAAGMRRPLAIPLRSALQLGTTSCNVRFNTGNRLVAVGVNQSNESTPIQIVVADLASSQILSNFLVMPDAVRGTDLNFAGFSLNQDILLVAGTIGVIGKNASISTRSYAFDGAEIAPMQSHELPRGDRFTSGDRWRDASHNRSLSIGVAKNCVLTLLPIVGGETHVVEMDGADGHIICDASTVAFPDEEIMISAADRGHSHPVTSLNLITRKVEQVELPPLAFGEFSSVIGSALSPDGHFVAISRIRRKLTFLGGESTPGFEVDVLQVSPLKFLGKILLSSRHAEQISLGERDGKLAVLSFDYRRGQFDYAYLRISN